MTLVPHTCNHALLVVTIGIPTTSPHFGTILTLVIHFHKLLLLVPYFQNNLYGHTYIYMISRE